MFFIYAFDGRARKRWEGLAEECQRRLTEQQIVPGNPGTILKDICTLLDFVGPGGIVTKSRNATFPAERLPELNAKISHPVKLALKRALLQDYPNLAGLFILLRVMDLLEVKGKRLVPGPTAPEFWPCLNPTEQYFALLEALLFQAQSSVLGGERRRPEEPAIKTVPRFLGQLSDHWRSFEAITSTTSATATSAAGAGCIITPTATMALGRQKSWLARPTWRSKTRCSSRSIMAIIGGSRCVWRMLTPNRPH